MVTIMTRMHESRLLIVLSALAALTIAGSAAAIGPQPQQAGTFAFEVAAILEEIAVYDYGDSREPLSDLRELVQANLDLEAATQQIEKAMIEFLASDATFAGKQFVAEQLSMIGTAASVPVLTTMLLDEQTADIALFALERIPGPAVDRVLRGSIGDADRMSRIAIINALGERGDAGSVGELEILLYYDDSPTARSAAFALGKIAGGNAAAALETARVHTTGDLRHVVLDAYLGCADAFLSWGESARAAGIYRTLYDEESSTSIRAAALRGLVKSEPEKAVSTILAALMRDNQDLQTVAAGLTRGLPPATDLTVVSDALSSFSDRTQIQLISAFAYRGETAVHQAVVGAIRHHDADVRAAALSALARIGDESDIDLLVETAVSGHPASNQMTARATLDRMPAAEIDEFLIAAIPTAEPPARTELVRSLGQRNSAGAIDVLLSTATDPDQGVRVESFKSLAIVARPDRVNDLIQLLVNEQDEGTRNEAERTVVLVSQKIEGADQAGPVLAALSMVRDTDARSSLIEVLGRIGDPGALTALNTELSGDTPEYRRAAILALSAWPDAGPSDELLRVAQSSDSPTERVLALRGFIELTRIESDRPEGESVERLQTAMGLATETSEKRMALAGLGELYTVEALDITVPYLDDPELRPEAEAALLRQIGRIRGESDERMQRLLDAGLREDLQRILGASENEMLRGLTTELLERGQ
jgi:HEAT repeat protein